ncbi:MAG: TetR/AcrR family transcriptional regulator [Actinomycetota bacterium]|nr:TetR/AcrR family transcriptional regulator [Actinomycetota bacterium]
MAPAATPRLTADERRAAILEVAREEFARRGFYGTSTELIATRAGVSQPYLFRLFRTKKRLFLACVEAGFRLTLERFRAAAEGRHGDAALRAMGDAYLELLRDRTLLQGQLQAYAAAVDDEEVRQAVRRGFGELVSFVEQASGADPARLSRFTARGMLLNAIASMGLLEARERWAKHLVEGCREEPAA